MARPGRTDHGDIEPSEHRPAFQGTSSWSDPRHIERRFWIHGRHYLLGSVSATIADGKTTLALTEAIAMATGKNLLGVEPSCRQTVLYWNGEESSDEIQRRVHTICQHFGLNARHDLTGWLFIASGDASLSPAPGAMAWSLAT